MTSATFPPTLRETDPDYARERYTVAQAAEYLCVGAPQIYRLVGRGQIGYRRVGRGELRFAQADLDRWRSAHRQAPTDAKSLRVGTDRAPVRPEVSRLMLPKVRRFA